MTSDPRVIVALDCPNIAAVRSLVSQLSPSLCRLKIGNILFTHYGPKLVEELMLQDFEVFLDLKFHDIPQTVAKSCRVVADLGVWMTNLHISSGKAAMEAAVEAIKTVSHKPPLLIGVTVLTSLEQSDLMNVDSAIALPDMVCNLAAQAQACGLDGVVCSSLEAAMLRSQSGKDFLLVTPGIRLEAAKDDQKRVLTPEQADKAGASYLVIGRPITEANNPLAILEQIVSNVY